MIASFILSALMIAGADTPAHADDAGPAILRPDGSGIVYRLESPQDADGPRGLLLVAQGSGCDPATLPGRFAHSERIAPGFTRLVIEKYGVDPSQPASGEDECPQAFYARDTLDQRVLDAARVISALRGAPWWNGELIVFGGSEGGAVAAMLAGIVPETGAVAVLSSGLGFTVAETVLAAVPPPARENIAARFQAARENASINEYFGGHSHQWWANALDKRPVNSMVSLDIPILVVQGGRDVNAPPQSARSAVAALREAGRCVRYDEYPELDHFMRDADGENHTVRVYDAMAQWAGEALRSDACPGQPAD